MSVEEDERTAMRVSAGSRLALIVESYARITGEPLVEGGPEEFEEALWHSPYVILAHGGEAVPRIFYANRQALDLYDMPAEAFIGMPSHLCAEPTRRHERVKVLTELEKRNLVEVDRGVRIASSGRRFRLARAKSWNLLDENGVKHGVVACYLKWQHLDPALTRALPNSIPRQLRPFVGRGKIKLRPDRDDVVPVR